MDAQACNDLIAVVQLTTAIATAIATIVMAVFTWLVWRVYERIAWFTGSIESYTEIQTVLLAQKEGRRVVWWDPTIAPVPTERQHRQPRNMEAVYIYVPMEERAGRKKVKAAVSSTTSPPSA